MDDKKPRCEHCYSNWRWTKPAYSKHEVMQIGCYGCRSIYNIVDDEYLLVGQRRGHPIFSKDLLRQWDEALSHIAAASSAKKKGA